MKKKKKECKHKNRRKIRTIVIITINEVYKCLDCGKEFMVYGEY